MNYYFFLDFYDNTLESSVDLFNFPSNSNLYNHNLLEDRNNIEFLIRAIEKKHINQYK